MNPVLHAFVQSASNAFAREDGIALSKLFVFDDQTLDVLGSRINISDDLDQYVSAISDSMHSQTTLVYLRYVRDRQTVGSEESHTQLCRIAELFTALLTAAQGPWLIPCVRSVALALCVLAQQVYVETEDSSAFTQSATRLLQLLIVILADSSPIENSKRQGALAIAGLLLRISLRTNAAPGAYAGRALEVSGLQESPAFSRRDQVSYSYWLGRYYLVCYYIDSARTQLEKAFNKCPAWHYHNKRVILRYLFVANVIRGRLPSFALLEKYDLEPVYYQLVDCFRKGNLAGFQQALVDNMELFRAQGNFLILLERTKLLIYRNVLRRVSLINRGEERSNVIQYRDVLTAFQVSAQNSDMDIFEMECILASLISQKLVLGFLFHHQKLVNLSRKTPFPAISHIGQVKPR
ncbi:hypothetical protein IWW50_000875 [Coemansia erecta]|nr:hypothetical protein IWW50_000875 [Coemansia erecta]